MAMKIAAALSWLLGLGFGLPCVYAIWYFAQHRQVWTFLGFPTYGEALFQRRGIETTVPLLVAFLVVCLAEVVVGWLLWDQPKAGAWLALALLPLELTFWIGFALPFGLRFGVVRTALILLSMSPPGHLGA